MNNRTWTGLQNDIAKFFQRPQPPQQMDGSSDTSVFLTLQKKTLFSNSNSCPNNSPYTPYLSVLDFLKYIYISRP